jgi:Tfp pilus assembly protein PilO
MLGFKKLLRLYNKFILPSLILAVCALTVNYGIIPGVKTIQNEIIKQQLLSKEITAIQARVRILESLDEDTLRSQVVALMTSVPPTKSIPTVFSTIETVAMQSGVTVVDMGIESVGTLASQSAEPVDPKTALRGNFSIPVKVIANGSLDQIKAFLDGAVSIRRLLRITNFYASIDKDNIVKASFVIDAFFAPLPKSLGKSSDPLQVYTANEEELLAKISSYPLISQELTNYDILPEIQYGSKTNPFSPLSE